jgi:hypothetical protein
VEAFAGIDLAFAKRKRLPVVVCSWEADRLIPRRVAERSAPDPPRGAGNVVALDSFRVAQFADETAAYLHCLEDYCGVSISRVAIDAPSEPRPEALKRRRAEEALDARRISYITTPTAVGFECIRERAEEHLRGGGAESHLPHANQLWMLVGFALFSRLRREWECLEVFPQATAFVLGASSVHKSKRGGVEAQMAAAAKHTGWPNPVDKAALHGVVNGAAHDGLDAYLAAWVAALRPEKRTALGAPPNDVIWVPTVGAAVQQPKSA